MAVLKKIDLSRAVAVLFFLFIGVLFYMFIQTYFEFKDYSATKQAAPNKTLGKQKLSPARNPSTTTRKQQALLFDPFSEDRRTLSFPGDSGDPGIIRGYKILGVIKAGQFYVVVENAMDKRTRLLPKGERLDQDHTIEDIFSHYILIRGPGEKLNRLKVFEYQEVKREKNSLSENQPAELQESPSGKRGKKDGSLKR